MGELSRGGAPRRDTFVLVLLLTFALSSPESHAYLGPGAGFALGSSVGVAMIAILSAVLVMLVWPFRALWRSFRRRRAKPWINRLVVIGFDGQEPTLTDRLLEEGKLPNFKRLAETGCYHRIGTSQPPISPVAWSCFSTGTGPGKHNIFDFIDRNPRNYLPLLSSAYIGKVDKVLKIGRYRFPLRKPEIRMLRKSKPFWSILGERGIWSTVLRVPITFPPDEFYGAQLSAMCVPDLLGTQGTFPHYTTRPTEDRIKEGGVRIRLEGTGDRFETRLTGPENTRIDGNPPLEIPMNIDLDHLARRARIKLGREQLELVEGELSGFVKLLFKAAPMVRVSGLCRMQVTEMGEHFSLYIQPLGIDPEAPAMPISHPPFYATYLAKKVGSYVTLGLVEDTWSLDEGVVDDGTFLQQTLDIDDERRRMFFVMSDHGFCAFRRGVNLNRWLLDHGYLVLREGRDGRGDWLADVDWSQTRVYVMGLTGMFLNLKGRESRGIVEPGDEEQRLKDEIISRLNGLADEEKGEVAINEVFDAMKTYRGPYRGNAPDLLVGYRLCYRVG